MKKISKLIALCMSMAMLLTACGNNQSGSSAGSESQSGSGSSSAVQTSASADTLRVVLNSEPSNLDPHNNTRLTSWAVQEEIFDKLVTKSESGEIRAEPLR